MSVLTIIVYVIALIAIGFLLNIGGWFGTIRLIDRIGRRLKFHQFVAVRHLRGRKSGFLTAIGILAILAVSVSSCNLVTVLSVMGGFSSDLKQKILSTNAHIVVDNFGGDLDGVPDTDLASWREVLAAVREVPDVEAATPVVQGEVMMNARTNNHGIQLKGIEPANFGDVSAVLEQLDKGEIAFIDEPEKLFRAVRERRQRLYGTRPDADAGPDPPGGAGQQGDAAPAASYVPAPVNPRQRVLPAVIVGRELSKALRLYIGEEVNIISPLGDIGPTGPIPKSRPFRVGGVFFSGMYEFDSLYVYTSLRAAQEFLRKGRHISEIQVAVADPDQAGEISARVATALDGKLRVRPWQELNASLFSALKLEKIVMFIFLSFAILVSSFCIIATLVMLVLEKEGEISVLRTLGATRRGVRRIFRFEGLLIGAVGTASGLLIGFGLCMSLKYVGLPIDPEVWYIDKLPVDASWREFLFVGLASLGITQIATLIATLIASTPNPVEGLKNG